MLTPIELLGKNIFFDKISVPNNMSCADCHGAKVGFTGPSPAINKHGAVYRGADRQSFGNRKPGSAAYATMSPIFYLNGEGDFVGGNFWDGRATGEILGNPAADQALSPFLNPVEHNVPDKLTVLKKISAAKYIDLWETVWGETIDYSNPANIEENYDRVGLSLAAYEGSAEVNQFSSKFDDYLDGFVSLTSREMEGMALFNGKAKCHQCHPQPLFTNFTYDNLGVPKNPENPVYDQDPAFIDYGLGGFLLTNPSYSYLAEANKGKHKVPTLRNVDKRPGKGFTKAYMHNGVFKSLKEVVHFYNTRDVESWPAPEVDINVNQTEIGNLGLTEEEEDAIVAFLRTLSDGYVAK
jgi:cytochrome c peroxidase